jgi:hypothetical protein
VRSLTRAKSIIIAVVAIAIAGGSYAIVSATSGSGSSTASTSFPRTFRIWWRIQRSVRAGARGNIRRSEQRINLRLHRDDGRGCEGHCQGDVRHLLREWDEPCLGECRDNRQARSRTGDDRQHDHHGHSGHRATAGRQLLDRVIGDLLPEGQVRLDKEGWPDPGGLITYRGRGRSSAERKRIRQSKPRWPPTEGHHRSCSKAGQRRLRGSQHRRQLAARHLRQPGLQGHRRRRLAVSSVPSIVSLSCVACR